MNLVPHASRHFASVTRNCFVSLRLISIINETTVSGYLDDQKCVEAAKIFLETSSHLHECRTVISNGRRFSTRVNGMTLIDIIEKFVTVNAASKSYSGLNVLMKLKSLSCICIFICIYLRSM